MRVVDSTIIGNVPKTLNTFQDCIMGEVTMHVAHAGMDAEVSFTYKAMEGDKNLQIEAGKTKNVMISYLSDQDTGNPLSVHTVKDAEHTSVIVPKKAQVSVYMVSDILKVTVSPIVA